MAVSYCYLLRTDRGLLEIHETEGDVANDTVRLMGTRSSSCAILVVHGPFDDRAKSRAFAHAWHMAATRHKGTGPTFATLPHVKKWLACARPLCTEASVRSYSLATEVDEERDILSRCPATLAAYDQVHARVHSAEGHDLPDFATRTIHAFQ